jgi:hypothetical protein
MFSRHIEGNNMRRVICLLIAVIVGATLWNASPTFSQTIAPKAAERRQVLDDQQAQRRMKIEQSNQKVETAVKARGDKRRACNKEAKAQKLSMFKRRGFVKQCMAGPS